MAETAISRLGSGGSIVWAILLIIFGFLAIALPFATSWGVVVIIAWLIVFSGGFQFIHAFQSKGVGHILWKLLVAVLYLILGLYFLLFPPAGIAAITFALAIFFVLEGVFDLVAYSKARHLPGSSWILFDGVITLILGVLIYRQWWQWPPNAGWVIGTLVGISMIFTGTTRLMLSLSARRLTHSAA